jgi:hypothetical protein
VSAEDWSRRLSAAFATVPGREANQWLWDTRGRLETEHGRVAMWEHVLSDGDDPLDLLDRLGEHLVAKKERATGGPHCVVVLWRGAELHALTAPRFWATIADELEIDLPTLVGRVEARRRARTAAAQAPADGPVLALPPPPDAGEA